MLGALSVEAGALALGWAVVTAGAGAIVTEIGPWYRGLRKPPWQPPDWAFGPAWTVIFLLTALAGMLSWNADEADRAYRLALGLVYLLNGALNVAWSVLFFRLRRPDWALLEVVPLWLSILLMIGLAGSRQPVSGWLLVPYLAWVSFAAALNRAVVNLNGPFEA
jgi:tryptophan-rich sensory protein